MKELTPDARGVDAAIEAAGLPEVWQIALRMARPGGEVLFFGGTKKAWRYLWIQRLYTILS